MTRCTEIEELPQRTYAGMRARDVNAITATITEQDGLTWIGTDPAE